MDSSGEVWYWQVHAHQRLMWASWRDVLPLRGNRDLRIWLMIRHDEEAVAGEVRGTLKAVGLQSATAPGVGSAHRGGA